MLFMPNFGAIQKSDGRLFGGHSKYKNVNQQSQSHNSG